MSEKIQSLDSAVARLKDFLIASRLRQTKERYAILEAAYEFEGTFTIDDLQQLMQAKRFHVSTATLYNTVQLLVQANLLIRHPFSSAAAVFERIMDDRPRSYQVCSHCHRITRLKSKELAASIAAYHPRRFAVSHRVVYIYGVCPKCEAIFRKNLRQQQNNI